jgi:hypothetical protein
MKLIGGLLLLFGVGSMVLYFLGMEFTLMQWIDNWGSETGWAIRIGMAVVGAVLFFIGSKRQSAF